MTGFLNLTINATGAELDADISGFKLKVGGTLDALKPLFAVLWQHLKEQMPTPKPERFGGLFDKLKGVQ